MPNMSWEEIGNIKHQISGDRQMVLYLKKLVIALDKSLEDKYEHIENIILNHEEDE